MNKKKPDSLCFNIDSLDHDQKVEFAKGLKKTVDSFNKDLQTESEDEE